MGRKQAGIANKKVARMIKEARKKVNKNGISQERLAEKCGCSISTVRRYENAKYPVSKEHAPAFSKVLGIPEEILLQKHDIETDMREFASSAIHYIRANYPDAEENATTLIFFCDFLKNCGYSIKKHEYEIKDDGTILTNDNWREKYKSAIESDDFDLMPKVRTFYSISYKGSPIGLFDLNALQVLFESSMLSITSHIELLHHRFDKSNMVEK